MKRILPILFAALAVSTSALAQTPDRSLQCRNRTECEAFVGWMTEFPISRPGAKLDLGDQGGLDPGNIDTSGIGQGRLLSLPVQFVQHLPQPCDN